MSVPTGASHSPDFSSVIWNGVEHSFTPMQAAIVDLLWQALENRTPDVHGSTLLEYAESQLQENRIEPLFFRNPAWKTMIVRGKKRGTYRLNPDAHLDDKKE